MVVDFLKLCLGIKTWTLLLGTRQIAVAQAGGIPLGARWICNPPLKNVLTFLGFADL